MSPHLLALSAFGLAALAAITVAPTSPSSSVKQVKTAASAVIETESVKAPRAYRRLCEKEPRLCAAKHAAPILAPFEKRMAKMFGEDALKIAPVVLTAERKKQLDRVNDVVNGLIEPRVDRGGDVWSLGALVGDCEEYVLMKREMLLRLGWPRTALRITVVHDGVGYHAVLIVSTDKGDFVLDNLVGYVSRAEDSPYRFVVAESLRNPGAWVRISKGAAKKSPLLSR
ncbi:MAG: transglutaminase-like cysteine peptidase [Neomegalonema sp.]|nr:transglutaminase-like cysteine peptidase [Neomegalonema sp.]